MQNAQTSIAHSVAKAAMALQAQQSSDVPCLVVAVASSDALVVTMCGVIPPLDRDLAKCPEQCAESRRVHEQHFTQAVEPLRREIERISDIPVLESSVDVDTTTGSVVYTFTTASLLGVCLLAGHTQADAWMDCEIIHQP